MDSGPWPPTFDSRGDDEPSAAVAPENRFVAGPGTARAFAGFAVTVALRSRFLWLVLGVSFVALAMLIFPRVYSPKGFGVRLMGAVAYGLLPTFAILLLGPPILYVLNLRANRPTLFEGAVLRSGFGDDAFVLQGTRASSRISYAAIKSIKIRREFVILRLQGRPGTSLWPQTLFPVNGLARIKNYSDRVAASRRGLPASDYGG